MAKLKKLYLENVGIHESMDIDFSDFTIISGANKEGKTTIERAILDAIEGTRTNLLRINSDEGKIELELDDGTKILQPLRADGKPSVKVFKDDLELRKPRTQLNKMSTAKIRSIDFFKGEGVKLEKEQVEILLSIINIELNKAEIEKICGEFPLEDKAEKLHPLDYINALVNTKDGYYYTERAKNNKDIQTIEHSIEGLRGEILEVFNENNINFDTFKPNEYNFDLTTKFDEVAKLRELKIRLDKAQDFLDIFDVELEKMGKAHESELSTKRDELKLDIVKKLGFDTISEWEFAQNKKMVSQLFNKSTEIIGENFDNTSNPDVFVESLKSIHNKISNYHNSLIKEIQDIKNGLDNKIDIEVLAFQESQKSEIEIFKGFKIEAEKLISDNKDIPNIDEMVVENNRIYKIQKILPTYNVFIEMKNSYEAKKETKVMLDDIIEHLRKLPKIMLQRSEMPVKQLTINDKGKFAYNNSNGVDIPLDQLSGFEQISLSLDISIAMLGDIRTLIIPQWSEVDEDNRKLIIEHLKANDVQGVAVEVGTGKIKIKHED